jgi:hypothetical protein
MNINLSIEKAFGKNNGWVLRVGSQEWVGTKAEIAEQFTAWAQQAAWFPQVALVSDGNEHTVIVQHAGDTCVYRGEGNGIIKLRHTTTMGGVDMRERAESEALHIALEHQELPAWLPESQIDQWKKMQEYYKDYKRQLVAK